MTSTSPSRFTKQALAALTDDELRDLKAETQDRMTQLKVDSLKTGASRFVPKHEFAAYEEQRAVLASALRDMDLEFGRRKREKRSNTKLIAAAVKARAFLEAELDQDPDVVALVNALTEGLNEAYGVDEAPPKANVVVRRG